LPERDLINQVAEQKQRNDELLGIRAFSKNARQARVAASLGQH
jgi:hypothetical protein